MIARFIGEGKIILNTPEGAHLRLRAVQVKIVKK